MDTVRNVSVLVGSLRRESFNRKVAQALMRLAPASLKLSIIEIGQLAFFNEDDEASPPTAWTEFRQRIKSTDAVLFVTPEYNRSVPAVLKNAVDVGSRPPGHSVWSGKPCAVISVSPGAIGGFGANNHLRQSLATLNMPTMPAPEMYIGRVTSLIDAEGEFDAKTREHLQKFTTAFAAWIEKNS
jgi:chromate reductase, NAD(P)H dehydrogenase (quinone)